ncbi:serine threonine kinase [Fusarium pseudoanthophilum]|uniref:Serine threonine kinase n=1 Tax=Fusarium pseudoanthophilum TaxID=48495 RepID=A0A8H5LD06_9HYPO|nr:serine threonine kinase [Fusarium pseudoanthophilum]
MQERIKQAIVDDSALRPAASDDLCGSFAATLLTHLIHLEWCDEAWLECITYLEKKIRKKLTIAKAARLDQPTNFQESALRKALRKNSNLSASTASGSSTEDGLKNWPQQKQGFWKPLTSCFRTASQSRSSPPILPVALEKQGTVQSEASDGFAKQLYSLMVLGTFSFEEVQDLHHLGEQLESFRLVIQVNRQTLRDISEHYQDVVSRSGFTAKMKKNSKRDLASFTRRVERVQKNLELRLTQVESLLAWLQEGKALFDGILQYRSVQVSHIFTESSHIQSEKMERIAHKTEQETISMHVVTCVTLAFLPGTFVAIQTDPHPTPVRLLLYNLIEFNYMQTLCLAHCGIALHICVAEQKQASTVKYYRIILRLVSQTATSDLILATVHHLGPRMDSCVQHFRDYVQSKWILGSDGEGKVVPYIPPCELEKYWTAERMNRILTSTTIPIDATYETISHGYLECFSILVFIDHCDKIPVICSNHNGLKDDNLPFTADAFKPMSKWSDQFLDAQWMFCPFIFSRACVYKRPLQPRTILPVTYDDYIKERRAGPDAAVLRKVQIHDKCNSVGQLVVFKVYEGIDSEERYNSETAVYGNLHDKPNDCIVKHVASFKFPHNHKFVIALEYAAHGSLLDYMRQTPQPVTPDDFALFWGRMFKLLDALHILSDIYKQNHHPHGSLTGVHQDIHPGNILVFPGTDSKSPYDVHFKITDFGLAEMGRVSAFDDALATSNTGNRMYISPEAFANFAVQDRFRPAISPTTDIWSLGAVFSDVLIWTVAGEAGREKYRRSRHEEIAGLPHLIGAGFDCCFHDGEKRLEAVQGVHDDALLHKRGSDDISPFISKLILRNMLIEQRGRLNAMQVRLRAEEGLQKIIANRTVPKPSANSASFVPTSGDKVLYRPMDSFPKPQIERRATVSSASSSPRKFPNRSGIQASPNQTWAMISMQGSISMPNDQSLRYTQTGDRILTVGEIYAMIEAKDKSSRRVSFRTKSSKRDEILELPGIQEARSKIRETKGREQIFIIDNFTSMQPHMEKVKKAARVISYVTKLADHNGMEVFAASETTMTPKICKHSIQVERAIGNFKAVRGTCRMRKCLDDILNRILIERPFKPTSIYIFTDGVWEQGDDQVEFAVNRATQFLIKHGLPSSSIMFQFIQFGHNAEGAARMKRLDDDCKKETEAEKFDIVDHKHCDAHVPDIVIGSLSPYTDEVEHRVNDTL